MDVTKLVQEDTRVQQLRVVEEYRLPQGESSDVRGAKRPAADLERKAARAEPRFAELRVPLSQ